VLYLFDSSAINSLAGGSITGDIIAANIQLSQYSSPCPVTKFNQGNYCYCAVGLFPNFLTLIVRQFF
jgi:hypothetical protein